jgi:hypothetical protein
VVVALLTVTPAALAATDLCGPLATLTPLSEEPETAPESDGNGVIRAGITKIVSALTNMMVATRDTTQSADENIGKVLFTVREGRSRIPDCDSKSKWAYSVYYPTGLVVRALDVQDLTQSGAPVKHYYVRTWNGLRVYIPAVDLAPMESDKVYFFATGALPIPYGHQTRTGYMPFEKRVLQWTNTYAVADRTPEIEAAIAEANCGPYPIRVFQNGAWTQERNRLLDICLYDQERRMPLIDPLSQRPVENANMSIRTLAQSESRLNIPIEGAFQRVSGSLVAKAQALLHGSSMIDKKSCQQSISFKNTFSAGGSLKGDFNIAVIEVEGATAWGTEKMVETAWPPDSYYRFGVYMLRMDDRTSVHDMIMIAGCSAEERTPERPQTLWLYNEEMPDGQTFLDAQDLVNSLKTNFNLAGYEVARNENDVLLGQFWRIKGNEQYVLWRDVIRREFEERLSVSGALDARDPAQADQLLDLLTHLVLSSIFAYEAPSTAH